MKPKNSSAELWTVLFRLYGSRFVVSGVSVLQRFLRLSWFSHCWIHHHSVLFVSSWSMTGLTTTSYFSSLTPVCKTRGAHGLLSHEMSLIFSARSLADIHPPCVLQSFINHGAVLHKVFVVGDRHFCVERPSLKNFPSGPCGQSSPDPPKKKISFS